MNYIIKNTETGLFVCAIKLECSGAVLWYEGSLLASASFGYEGDAEKVIDTLRVKSPNTKLEVMKIYRDKNKQIRVDPV
jgi:lipoate-protein ligase A